MENQITSEIPEDLDGARLDKALASILGLSRAQARDMIERGALVDGEPGRPGSRVTAGAVVVSDLPERDESLHAEAVEFDVLFEDGDVVVVDKPAGVVVHPGSGRKTGTLAAGLLHRYPEIRGVGALQRWGLVHRLDRDTSGALLVARTQPSYDSLSAQIRKRSVRRIYKALVDGVPGAPTGTIEAPLGRDPEYPMRRAVIPGGKHARTHFEVDETFEPSSCSLLSLRLETGRTHQIRVHLAAIGHPVVGDKVYGKKSNVDSPRIFLHASELEFVHPTDGRQLRVESPLPADLAGILENLRGTADH